MAERQSLQQGAAFENELLLKLLTKGKGESVNLGQGFLSEKKVAELFPASGMNRELLFSLMGSDLPEDPTLGPTYGELTGQPFPRDLELQQEFDERSRSAGGGGRARRIPPQFIETPLPGGGISRRLNPEYLAYQQEISGGQ